MFFYNSDSLGLLTLKADGRLRVHGGGDSVVPRWCVGGISMVSRSCLDGVPVVSQWCLGTFKEMQALRSFTSAGFKKWRTRCSFSRNILQTPCNYVQYMCTVQMKISTCCKYHPTCSFDLQKAAQ